LDEAEAACELVTAYDLGILLSYLAYIFKLPHALLEIPSEISKLPIDVAKLP